MKIKIEKISVILLVALLAFSSSQMFAVNALNESAEITIPEIDQKIPLTNAQIEAKWPNLPSAQQIYEKDVCMVVDLRYSGKQASSMDDILPDPKSPTVFDITSSIANFTTTTFDYYTGKLNINAPQIWLQYNSTVWLRVPPKYLQTATTIDKTQPAVTTSTPTTWAVGMYANPQNVAGAYPVTGVCSYGQWNTATFGTTGMYLGTNVLSVCSGNLMYQQIMKNSPAGPEVFYEVLNSEGNSYSGSWGTPPNLVLGQTYNNYIRYATGDGWQFWFDTSYMGTIRGDPSTTVITGNQPNVVVESNDFTSSHFNDFLTIIGGTYNPGNYPLCAAVYEFNGGWHPIAPGDSAPAGYVYLGGTTVNGITIGGQAPPSNWGSNNIGIYSGLRERFAVGVGLTQQSHGYTLWTSGTV